LISWARFADQLPVRLLLLEDLLLARDLDLLVELAQLQHQARGARIHRADDAMQVHAIAAEIDLQVVLVEARVGSDRLLQALG
jgi:hypothetical protein